MKTPWIALGSLVALALTSGAIVSPAGTAITTTAMPAAQTIHIRAHIDGISRLILDDDTAQWRHIQAAAPGRHNCNSGVPIKATYVDGQEWWPQWPDLPDCENRSCNCFSDKLAGLTPGVPNTTQIAIIVPIAVRNLCTIVEMPRPANGYRVVIEFNDHPWPGSEWYEIELVLETVLGETYCFSLPNSTGQPATLRALGSLSVVANDTYLEARACPPGCMGVFFYGADELKMPFANGYLCINPFGPGGYRVSPGSCAGPNGEARVHLDFPSLPPAGAITSGSTWCFQYWFRDPAGGGARSNLSHGLRLTFLP